MGSQRVRHDWATSLSLSYTNTHTQMLINEFSKVTWYRIKEQKSIALLFTSSEKWKNKIKTTPLTILSKRIKYLGKILT